MTARTDREFLAALHRYGAPHVERVVFRANRSTIWSLSRGGRVLNLHAGYRTAPATVVEAFAIIAREAHRRSDAYREAVGRVREWPELFVALQRARQAHRLRSRSRRRRRRHESGPCCGTPEQLAYLRRLYRYLNVTRFDGLLPDDLPIRLSNRMKSRLGHMVPGRRNGRERYVVEIALNVDLMLEGNGKERTDTLIHEMAHAADYLFDGGTGHGPTWIGWARYAGCDTRACTDAPIVRRGHTHRHVTRVPPLPIAARITLN